ncbi:MAG: hypothetical protein ACJ78Q_18045 [Chloroflexia bacterium]
MKPKWRAATLLPPLFFLGWAILFSFPLALHLGDSVALARGGDAWLHIWDLWWLDKALVDLHQGPYFTNYLLYPTGLNLFYHSLDLFNGLISIPLQHLLGLTATFNLLLIANLTLDGLAAYWLCFDRTRSVGAAIVGGAIFASTPLLGTSVDLGQLDEVTVWWVPLYMLALWRAVESPGPVWRPGGGRRAALAAGVCLVGASLATWYFTAGLAVYTVVFVLGSVVSGQWSVVSEQSAQDNRQLGSSSQRVGPSAVRRLLIASAKVGVAVFVFVVALSPLLVGMVRERLGGATYMLPTLFATKFNSADLVGLFLPPRLDTEINRHESSVALGYVALSLGVVGLVAYRRTVWLVGLALVVLVVMAMGPELQVAGNQTGVLLPYALLNNVPFIGASRQPLRFLATADACIALLAGYGALWLMGVRWLGNWRRAVVPVVLGLVALEVIGVPRALASTATGPGYAFLKDSEEAGAVLEVPAETRSAPSLLDQTTHERPIVGGYTSRHFPYPFGDAAPGVAQLFGADPDPLTKEDIVSPPVTTTALVSLDHYGVRFVVVNKADMATGHNGRLETVLESLFTEKDKVYEDGEILVYQSPVVSEGSRADGRALPLVGLGSGWHKVEENPVHRWTGSNVTDGNALVWVGVPPGAEGHYTLEMTGYAYKEPRHVSVLLDDRVLMSKEVGTAFEDVSVDLGNLAVGDHILKLKVAEPPESPPGDTRKLGIGVTRLAIQPGG